MWGADGMVDMWDSKSHAARHASSSLALPTIKRKKWIFLLMHSLKRLTKNSRNSVVVCRNTTITCLNNVYGA